MRPLVYYAHPISLYGSPQEKRDVELLEALGFQVINPNTSECDAGYKVGGMDFFESMVVQCNLLAFRAFPDGSIPSGIAFEIGIAQREDRPIIELPSRITGRTLDKDQTREYLREIGYR